MMRFVLLQKILLDQWYLYNFFGPAPNLVFCLELNWPLKEITTIIEIVKSKETSKILTQLKTQNGH